MGEFVFVFVGCLSGLIGCCCVLVVGVFECGKGIGKGFIGGVVLDWVIGYSDVYGFLMFYLLFFF